MLGGEQGAAILIGQNRCPVCSYFLSRLDDLLLIHSDQRAKQGQVRVASGEVQTLNGLTGYLSQALPGHQAVMVMQAGQSIIQGTPDTVKNDPQVQEAYLGGAKHCSR